MPSLETIISTAVTVLLLVYWGVAFTILYHLTRFGVGVQPKRLAAIFLLGSVVLSAVVLILFSTIDIGSVISQ
mgnify:FL=1